MAHRPPFSWGSKAPGRAEANGVKATAGKVLGVLDVIGGIMVLTIYFASNR